MTWRKYAWPILTSLLMVTFLVNISTGSIDIPLSETFKILVGLHPSEPVWRDILIDFRLTKSMTCVFAGSALSLGGLLMQTLFRNPLAGPDVLGLSSGASLMVALIVMAGGLGFGLMKGPFLIIIGASLGSALILFLVLAVAQKVKDNTSLLIVGLMLAAGTSSIVSVLQFTSRTEDQHFFLVWTFGSMGGLNWNEISILGIMTFIGSTLSILILKPLNAWLLGDNYASSMGIKIGQARLLIIISTSLLAGSVTAFCGPIAFVGLAVPHLTRIVIDSADHKVLIPSVMITGSALMLFCDTIAQLPGSTYVLPINVVTALIGAPVVIWVIMRSKKIRM